MGSTRRRPALHNFPRLVTPLALVIRRRRAEAGGQRGRNHGSKSGHRFRPGAVAQREQRRGHALAVARGPRKEMTEAVSTPSVTDCVSLHPPDRPRQGGPLDVPPVTSQDGNDDRE